MQSIDETTDPAAATTAATTAAHYMAPDWFTRKVFNPFVAGCTKLGISVFGSRVLSVSGRVSGHARSTPVNVLTLDDHRYLVAARGETEWVKNVRVAGGCTLRVGQRVETVRLRELEPACKPAVLRAYLRRWNWEVGRFFDGVGADSTDGELLAVAQRHPVFEVDAV